MIKVLRKCLSVIFGMRWSVALQYLALATYDRQHR